MVNWLISWLMGWSKSLKLTLFRLGILASADRGFFPSRKVKSPKAINRINLGFSTFRSWHWWIARQPLSIRIHSKTDIPKDFSFVKTHEVITSMNWLLHQFPTISQWLSSHHPGSQRQVSIARGVVELDFCEVGGAETLRKFWHHYM